MNQTAEEIYVDFNEFIRDNWKPAHQQYLKADFRSLAEYQAIKDEYREVEEVRRALRDKLKLASRADLGCGAP